jgi:hypothetical protein
MAELVHNPYQHWIDPSTFSRVLVGADGAIYRLLIFITTKQLGDRKLVYPKTPITPHVILTKDNDIVNVPATVQDALPEILSKQFLTDWIMRVTFEHNRENRVYSLIYGLRLRYAGDWYDIRLTIDVDMDDLERIRANAGGIAALAAPSNDNTIVLEALMSRVTIEMPAILDVCFPHGRHLMLRMGFMDRMALFVQRISQGGYSDKREVSAIYEQGWDDLGEVIRLNPNAADPDFKQTVHNVGRRVRL